MKRYIKVTFFDGGNNTEFAINYLTWEKAQEQIIFLELKLDYTALNIEIKDIEKWLKVMEKAYGDMRRRTKK